MHPLPQQVKLTGQKHFRIIPSVFPPINFFEDLVDPAEMETLWEIESLTNERIRQEIGDIFLVPAVDRMSGPGSSVIMAAFTHIGQPSRFSDGSFGVYYAGLSQETAVLETVYHREQFLRATQEAACELTMRVYTGKIIKPLHDLRPAKFRKFHALNDYTVTQKLGRTLKKINAWGIVYPSARAPGGQCIAIFRPPAISKCTPHSHLRYVWNGEKITKVFVADLLFNL